MFEVNEEIEIGDEIKFEGRNKDIENILRRKFQK